MDSNIVRDAQKIDKLRQESKLKKLVSAESTKGELEEIVAGIDRETTNFHVGYPLTYCYLHASTLAVVSCFCGVFIHAIHAIHAIYYTMRTDMRG
jgi:hypothetical protein